MTKPKERITKGSFEEDVAEAIFWECDDSGYSTAVAVRNSRGIAKEISKLALKTALGAVGDNQHRVDCSCPSCVREDEIRQSLATAFTNKERNKK